MSTYCKLVKGISLLLMLLGILSIAVAALMFFGAPIVDLDIEDGVLIAQVLAGYMAVMGILEVVTGVLGARGANNPARLQPFIVCATIVACVNMFEVAMTFMEENGGSVWLNILYTVVAFVGIVFASRAKRDATSL